MRQIGDGDKAMLEPLPGKVETDGNAAILHLGDAIYVTRVSLLMKHLAGDLRQ